jgi:hypothetical protein
MLLALMLGACASTSDPEPPPRKVSEPNLKEASEINDSSHDKTAAAVSSAAAV